MLDWTSLPIRRRDFGTMLREPSMCVSTRVYVFRSAFEHLKHDWGGP